jgi:hypothetical protein
MEIGDKVKVVKPEKIYPKYDDFAEKYNLQNWKFGRIFKCDVYEQTFIIKKIEEHLTYKPCVLCVIADENEQEYIVGIEGLKRY